MHKYVGTIYRYILYTGKNTMEPETPRKTKGNQYTDLLTPNVLLVLIFLFPFFFIPSPLLGIVFGKTALLVLGTMLAVIVYGVNVLRTATYRLPHVWLFVFAFLLPLTYTISAFLGPATRTSLIGHNLSLNSVFITLSFVILTLVIAATTHTKRQLFRYYYMLGLSVFIVALFHIIRFVGGTDILSFGIFNIPSATLVGKWNDLAILFGLSSILSLIALMTSFGGRKTRLLSYILLAVSLFFLVVVNFSAVWYVVGIFSILSLVYLLSFNKPRARKDERLGMDVSAVEPARKYSRIGFIPVSITLLFAALFIFATPGLQTTLSDTLGINYVEVRPSTESTFGLAKSTLERTTALFGIGPNRFDTAWFQYKPAGINQTLFWQVGFTEGVAVVPTALITTGVLGVIAWLLLALYTIYSGARALASHIRERVTSFLLLASSVGALYLWLFMFIYTPSIVVRGLVFVFTGIVFATLYCLQKEHIHMGKLPERPAANFVLTLLLLILIFAGALGGYTALERVVGEVYHQQGVQLLNQGNVAGAQDKLLSAIRLFPDDVYQRDLSQAYLLGIRNIVQDQSTDQNTRLSKFQTELGNAIGAAQQATKIDETDYQNWLTLGAVYESIVPLNIDGAYKNAVIAYDKALEHNPGPDVLLTQARLEVNNGNVEAARALIAKALKAKTNYIDAIFLLAQIQLSEGNTTEAIHSVEVAALASPNNPNILFQLGLLHYGSGSYTQAIAVLEQAISLSPIYANARYFLGLSYDQVGRTEDAIEQFKRIQETNPDNTEVQFILENLRAGRDAFEDAQPPLDIAPEEREGLPLEEKEAGETPVEELSS